MIGQEFFPVKAKRKNKKKVVLVPEKDEYVISFSGGRTSAFMACELLKDAKYKDAHILFCNTGKESESTLLFVKQCSDYWFSLYGKSVIWLEYCPLEKFKVVNYETAARNGEPFSALIKKKKFVPNIVSRFCTQELKIRIIKHYMYFLGIKNWIALIGIRYDEPKRYNKVKSHKDAWDNEYPLVGWKIVKKNVLDFWKNMPFDLDLGVLGEIIGNCDFCFLKGINKRLKIAREKPEILDWWANEELKTGASFQKGMYVKDILKKSKVPQLFPPDATPDFECFCNVD